ncbi:MAG: threonine synthase [Pyrinomonadaceae bacterium]|nr:threonine synthase [Pyrinomonadaceae bacterium]
MRYFSTNRSSPSVSFREAVLRGQPDDRGLYFPAEIPHLGDRFVTELPDLDNAEIAFRVIRPFVGGEIDDASLDAICRETVDFEFPLVSITDRISVLELFHGPTLAFKDVGARFMSRCLRHFAGSAEQRTVVIVATSGDTGGAVAAGFHDVEGIEVVILYPRGRVSRIQELQLTTLGGNITAFEIDGAFDDCQAIAKHALADADLRARARLTSANSINVARWLPQQFYYFFALKQWQGPPPVISVPSGNFGNLAAGMLAHASGLPVKRFIAACNANDVVPRFLVTGKYKPVPSVATLSNAMDVGDPSNFSRIMELCSGDIGRLRERLVAAVVTDDATAATIRDVDERYGYTLDPHGAVGYRCLADHLDNNSDDRGFFLETAHPVKFDSVNEIIGRLVAVPPSVEHLFSKGSQSVRLPNDYQAVKDILLSRL